MIGPPSTWIWKLAGAPLSSTLSAAVTWCNAQMLRPLRAGMGLNVVLEVVAAVVVHFDACRSSDELKPPEDLGAPEAARTAVGTPATKASSRLTITILRKRDPLSSLAAAGIRSVQL